jgi:hypothetical protein
MKSTAFWVVTPCSSPASAGFLIGSLFDPEDGCNMFLRNVGLSLSKLPCFRHKIQSAKSYLIPRCSLGLLWAMKMDAVRFSETPENLYQATRRQISDHNIIHLNHLLFPYRDRPIQHSQNRRRKVIILVIVLNHLSN